MSESTRTTADGGTSDTLDVEDLFATDDTDISIDDGESDDQPVTPGSATVTPDAEDTTADELFAQLRAEQDDADQAHAVDDLAEESPDEIMARADEDEAHVDQIDASIRADEGALDDLLLTERREADGFLWVETEDDAATDEDIGSLFASDDESDASIPEADTAEAGDADDGFSLSDDPAGSFDARAATFDDADDFAADAAAFTDDDESDTDDVDATAEDGEADESTPDLFPDSPDDDEVATPDASDRDSERADAASASRDDADDEDGLASRIRSILTG